MVQLVEEFLLGKCVQESFVVDKGWTTDGDFQLFVKVAKEDVAPSCFVHGVQGHWSTQYWNVLVDMLVDVG